MLSFLLLANAANAFFILSTKTLLSARMDPIVSSGGVSGHLHDIAGGNAFKSTYSYQDSITSSCTTMPVTLDKSNYWAPAAYYHHPTTGEFHKLKGGFNVYYLFRNGSKKTPIKAWPKGLKMLAGNPFKTTYNATNHADQAVSYVCLDYRPGSPNGHEGPTWPKTDCPNGVRVQIFFPSCWDGKNLDSADHSSHMAYPLDNYNSGNCPKTHPVQLISLFYEHIVDTTPYKYYGPGSFVLATGDKIGYGNHGDFTNGWDRLDLLQKAVDTCDDRYGVLNNCAVLKPYINNDAASACQPKTKVPMENVGLWGPLKALPGNNPLFSPSAYKPATNAPANPVFGPISVAGSINGPAQFAKYNKVSTTTKATTTAKATSTKKATVTSTKKVTTTKAATSTKKVTTSTKKVTTTTKKATATSGSHAKRDSFRVHRRTSNSTENIIYPRHLELEGRMEMSLNTAGALLRKRAVTSSVIPSGWKAKGCFMDIPGRALKAASTTNSQQELGTCIAFCASKGYKFAGAEYAKECYCGNSIPAAAKKVAAAQCTTTCAGNVYQQCGGGQRLTIFEKV